MSYSKNRAIVLAVTEGGMDLATAATQFHVTSRRIRVLLERSAEGGLPALEPRSRRPHHSPKATPAPIRQTIIELRGALIEQGLDAGARSIYARLPPEIRPSPATIWLILTAERLITPQPHKHPHSSWHRFEAAAPNSLWQSDFTHWRLLTPDRTPGADYEIISWLDDHSRYLLHISAHARITCPIVIATFLAAADACDLPAATLTDNGMVYTARLARGADGHNHQPNAFEASWVSFRFVD